MQLTLARRQLERLAERRRRHGGRATPSSSRLLPAAAPGARRRRSSAARRRRRARALAPRRQRTEIARAARRGAGRARPARGRPRPGRRAAGQRRQRAGSGPSEERAPDGGARRTRRPWSMRRRWRSAATPTPSTSGCRRNSARGPRTRKAVRQRLAEQRDAGAPAGAGAAQPGAADSYVARGRAGGARARARRAARARGTGRGPAARACASELADGRAPARSRRSERAAVHGFELRRAGAEAERRRHLVAETREREAHDRADAPAGRGDRWPS